MRKALFAGILLLASPAVFATSPCTNPTLTISGIQGDGCGGSIDFASANYSTTTNQLTVVKYMDQSSPKLINDCATNTRLQKVILSYPNMSTDGTNHPTTVTFEDVVVAAVDESINPTNETVQFNYAKRTIVSGGSQTTSSVRGSARAATLTVAVVGGDGKTQSASHFMMSIRPGGVTTSSVELVPAVRNAMLKVNPSVNAAPQPHMDNGVIEIRSPNGVVLNRFAFTGGLMNGNSLRVQKLNLAGAAAMRP
jgi:type VI protein secretion system component Hcp